MKLQGHSQQRQESDPIVRRDQFLGYVTNVSPKYRRAKLEELVEKAPPTSDYSTRMSLQRDWFCLSMAWTPKTERVI